MADKDIFNLLWEGKELPKEAKEEFMGTLDTLKLFASITDLFTLKKGMAAGAMLEAFSDSMTSDNDFEDQN